MAVGIALGILIGVITGAVVLLLLRTALGQDLTNVKAILTIVAELLAMPTFWFGGPWLATRIAAAIELQTILPYYMMSLAITFVLIALYPLIKLVIRIGGQIGQIEGAGV